MVDVPTFYPVWVRVHFKSATKNKKNLSKSMSVAPPKQM